MKSLFASNVLEVLSVLFVAGDESVHQSEIATHAGLRLVQAQRALQRLSEADLLLEQHKGNMICYKLNQHHPIYSTLKEMLYKTVLIAEPLKEVVEPVAEYIKLLFIYGSVASGNENVQSDLDLFVVGDLGLKKLSATLSPIAKRLHREVNPIVYSSKEFIKKVKAKDHFITSVLNAKRLWIIGDENELRALVK